MNGLRLESVTKRYAAGVCPVKDLSLEVSSGECLVIQGASGCGKTTLLNLMGCLVRPTEGRIWVGEKEVSLLPDQFLSRIRRNRIGFIFQQYNLLTGFTSLQNVCMPLVPIGIPSTIQQQRAMARLESLNVSHRAAFVVNDLSGGEQQRVAIARALINDPDIILADEPNSNVDETTSRGILRIFQQLRKKGKTIIVATHDRYFVKELKPDRSIVLQQQAQIDFAIQSIEEQTA